MNKYGLSYTRATSSAKSATQNLTAIKSQIDVHHPVIVAVNNSYGKSLYSNVPGTFNVPHIVIITGYQADNNGTVQTVYINDPLAISSATTGPQKGKYIPDLTHGKNYALTASAFTSAASARGWEGDAVIQVPPAAPVLTATATDSTHVVLTWTENPANATTFWIYRGRWNGTSWIDAGFVAGPLTAGTRAWIDSKLTPGTWYGYIIDAGNQAGWTWSNGSNVQTKSR